MTALFDVVLIGFPDGPKAGATAAEALSQVFGVPMDQAEKVVARMPTAIRKGVSEGDFRKFNGAFTFMGAVGEFRPVSGDGATMALGRPTTVPMPASALPSPVVTASSPSVRVSEPSGASELARIGLAKARVDQVSGAVVGLRASGSVPINERSRPSGSAAVAEGSSGFLDEELDALPTGEGWSDDDEAPPPFESLQGLPIAADLSFEQPLGEAGGFGAWQPAEPIHETEPLRAEPAPLPQPMLGAAPARRPVIETGSVPQSPSIAAYFKEPAPAPVPPVAAFASLDAVDELAVSLFGGSPEAGRSTGDEILFGDPLDFALDPLGLSLSTDAVEPDRAPAPPMAAASAVRHPWSRGSGNALALLSPSANLPVVEQAMGSPAVRPTGSVAALPSGDPNDASRVPGLGGALHIFSGSFVAPSEAAPAAPVAASPKPDLAGVGRRELSGAAAALRPSLSLTPGESAADAQPASGRRPAPQSKAVVRRGPLADKSFNESIGYCLALPLQPSGYYWVGLGSLFGLIGYLGVGVGHKLPFAGLPLMLVGLFGTVAFAFGIFAACMRATLAGEKDVDAPPSLTSMVSFVLNATPLVVCAMLLGSASLGWLGTKADAVQNSPMMTIATTFILGAPLAYWPMALAFAVKSGAPTKVFAFGTVVGRIVAVLSHYILVVFLGAVALFIVFAGLTEAVGTDSLRLLQALGGLVAGAAIMVAHGVMGGLMGKLLHDDPNMFDR